MAVVHLRFGGAATAPPDVALDESRRGVLVLFRERAHLLGNLGSVEVEESDESLLRRLLDVAGLAGGARHVAHGPADDLGEGGGRLVAAPVEAGGIHHGRQLSEVPQRCYFHLDVGRLCRVGEEPHQGVHLEVRRKRVPGTARNPLRRRPPLLLSVSKVLITQNFSNHRNFGTTRDTSDTQA